MMACECCCAILWWKEVPGSWWRGGGGVCLVGSAAAAAIATAVAAVMMAAGMADVVRGGCPVASAPGMSHISVASLIRVLVVPDGGGGLVAVALGGGVGIRGGCLWGVAIILASKIQFCHCLLHCLFAWVDPHRFFARMKRIRAVGFGFWGRGRALFTRAEIAAWASRAAIVVAIRIRLLVTL
jgi:hypothetical protein